MSIRSLLPLLLGLLLVPPPALGDAASSWGPPGAGDGPAPRLADAAADRTPPAAPMLASAAPPDGSEERGAEPARAITPARTPPAVPPPALEATAASPWWTAGFQSTYVLQRKQGFAAPYTGPNSLTTGAETGYTLTATLFLGARPWSGAEAFLNLETIQAQSLSHLSGLGGLSNGEAQKGGGPVPELYRARAFLRQTFALGGEDSAVEAGGNQLQGKVASRRLVVTAGNLAWADVFDGNAYSHDPRTQFLDWALMSYGAADYAADVRGYSWGVALELYRDDWAFRLGRFAQPIESNGLALDPDLLAHYGDTIEVEHAHALLGRAGKVRVLGFHNRARMGSFVDALHFAAANGGAPDVAAVRRDQSKYGFGASLEQEVAPDVGAFARASANDGRTETYAFAEIERSLAVGVSLKGHRWGRDGDTLGVAWVGNALSGAHREYLRAGGLGFLIGDGRLDRYRPEQILEAYYGFRAFRGFWVTVDAQRVANPAYNPDRGPVNILGLRCHLES